MSRDSSRKESLKAALQAIRRKRGLHAADVAGAMNLPLRSYEYFESGSGQLNIDRIRAFAEATNSDPIAILAAVEFCSPQIAVRCADNKLGLILAYAVSDFDKTLGDGISRLEAATLIQAFGATFADLADRVRERDEAAARWLDHRGDPNGSGPEGTS